MSRRTKNEEVRRAASAPSAPRRSYLWLHLFFLIAISVGVYANSLHNGFVSDDDFQILSNKFITDVKYIPQLLTSNVWSFAEAEETNYYRPLFMLLYMAEYFAFGYDPFYWHVVNLLLHLAAVAAAYLLLRALADEKIAFLATVLFALHPVHVEAVVWVAVLTDVLCGLALFLGVWLYHRARQGHAVLASLCGAALAFFIGLMVKETAFVFPALLLAYDFFYRRESVATILRGWMRYLPFAAVLVVYLPMRLHALGGRFAPSSGMHFKLTAWEMLLSVPVLFAQYVGKLLLPVNLNYYYVYTPVRAFGWKPAAAMLLVAALVALMFWLRAQQPLLSFSIAWFFLTLAPVLSIPNVGENVFTERYLYIPSLGFCAIAAWGYFELRARAKAPAARHALTAALVVICVFCGYVIVQRNPDWHDDIRLFSKTAQQSPESATILMDLGYIYFLNGRTTEAIDYYQRSLVRDDSRALTHNNLGNALTNVGRHDDAIVHLRRAIELKPDYFNAWMNLGLVYAAKKEWDAAIECYKKSIEMRPRFHDAWTALGLAYWAKGQPREAIAAYRKAIEYKPDFIEARINLASALAESGQLDEASEHLNYALKLNPNGPHASVIHFNLGINYERKQQWKFALAEYERALAMNPGFDLARKKSEYLRSRVATDSPQLPSPLAPARPQF